MLALRFPPKRTDHICPPVAEIGASSNKAELKGSTAQRLIQFSRKISREIHHEVAFTRWRSQGGVRRPGERISSSCLQSPSRRLLPPCSRRDVGGHLISPLHFFLRWRSTSRRTHPPTPNPPVPPTTINHQPGTDRPTGRPPSQRSQHLIRGDDLYPHSRPTATHPQCGHHLSALHERGPCHLRRQTCGHGGGGGVVTGPFDLPNQY